MGNGQEDVEDALFERLFDDSRERPFFRWFCDDVYDSLVRDRYAADPVLDPQLEPAMEMFARFVLVHAYRSEHRWPTDTPRGWHDLLSMVAPDDDESAMRKRIFVTVVSQQAMQVPEPLDLRAFVEALAQATTFSSVVSPHDPKFMEVADWALMMAGLVLNFLRKTSAEHRESRRFFGSEYLAALVEGHRVIELLSAQFRSLEALGILDSDLSVLFKRIKKDLWDLDLSHARKINAIWRAGTKLVERWQQQAPTLGKMTDSARLMTFELVQAALNDEPIVFVGETGTGKELGAKVVHELRFGKGERPMITVNLGALTETLQEAELFGIEEGAASTVKGRKGAFREADGGTIFLDELGDASIGVQRGLLRVLAQGEVTPVGSARAKKVSVRIVAATNKLKLLSPSGREQEHFREDLAHRLQFDFALQLQPLRDRPKQDVYDAWSRIVQEHAGRPVALSERDKSLLDQQQWDGNLRQLAAYARRVGKALRHLPSDSPELLEELFGFMKYLKAQREPADPIVTGTTQLADAILQRLSAQVAEPLDWRDIVAELKRAFYAAIERTGRSTTEKAALLRVPVSTYKTQCNRALAKSKRAAQPGPRGASSRKKRVRRRKA